MESNHSSLSYKSITHLTYAKVCAAITLNSTEIGRSGGTQTHIDTGLQAVVYSFLPLSEKMVAPIGFEPMSHDYRS